MSTPSNDFETLCLAVFEHMGPYDAYSLLYRKPATPDVGIQNSTRNARSYHSTVLAAIAWLKKDPTITLDGLKREVHKNAANETGSSAEHAIQTAVQSLLMVDTKANVWYPPGYSVHDYRPTSWLPNERFHEFISRQFAMSPASERVITALEEKHKLRAWVLHSRHGLRLQPTDNLAKHLVYDSRNRCVWFFQHSSFLKGQLKKIQNGKELVTLGVEDSIKRGLLPPQLLFETLHSLRTVLFSPVDRESDKLLKNLISEHQSIDRDLREQFSANIIPNVPDEAYQYKYWGKRLADLYDAVGCKRPRNSLEEWFDRQSTEGNALFVALVALFISIVVGIISIGLAVFQSWVAWMAWKHPVSQN